MNSKQALKTPTAVLCGIILPATPIAAQDGVLIGGQIFDLGEIVVSATARPTERNRTGASVEVLDSEAILDTQTTRLSDTLERLPGVSATQNGPAGTSAELSIRGSRERYTAVYIDGIKVNDPTSTTGQYGNFGTIANSNVTRVEVLKGSQSALYGGAAVAGVVNIFTLPDASTPEGISQQAEFLVGSYGTVSGSYALVQKQDQWTLNFGISHFESDGFSAADENNGNTEDDPARETRFNFGAAYQFSDQITVGINGFATDASSEFDEYAAEPTDGTPDELSKRDSKGLRLYATIDGEVWDQDIALSYFRIDRSFDSPTIGPDTEANGGTPYKSDFTGERYRLDYSAATRLSDNVTLTLGGDLTRETAEYANLTSGSEDIDIWGVFAEGVYSPTGDLDITATLRHDDHSSFGGKTTGRLAFAYRASDQLTLRGAAATGYRPPSIDELYGNYPGAYPFEGNPDLTPETSQSIEFGADYNYASGARVSATAFLTEIDDLITYQYGFPTSSLENIPGTSKRRGIELSGVVPLAAGYELFGSYTYIDAEDATGAQLRRVPKHALVAGLAATITQSLDAQILINHVADRADESGQTMGDYTVVNASLSYDLSDRAEAFIRFDNIFDEDYQTIAGYGTAGRSVFVGVRASF